MRYSTPLVRSLFAILITLAPVPEAIAQCRKRVLLYVDMSRSMGAGTNSPFDQTIAAMIELLRQPGLFSPDDSFLLIEFGRTPGTPNEVVGPAQAESVLRHLRRPDEQETDIARVFDDVVRRVGENADRNRDIVLIASDFSHDPVLKQTGDANQRLNAWTSAAQVEPWAAPFRPAQDGSLPKAALALLRAGVDSGSAVQRSVDQNVSDGVLHQLDAVPASHLAIGRSAADPEQLARALSKLFYVPPAITATLTAPQQFTVTARNRGCMPLTLTRATAKCNPSISDGISRDFPPESHVLPGIGAGVERSLALDVKELSCPNGKYEFLVATRELEQAAAQAERRSRIESEVERTTLAPSLLGKGRLEVRLKLWGVALDHEHFDLVITTDGAGSAEPAVVRGRVQAPKDLATDRSQAGSYRVTIPVTPDAQKKLETHQPQLRIEALPGADLRLEPPDRRTAVLDVATKVLLPLAGFLVAGMLVLNARNRWHLLDRASSIVGLVSAVAPTSLPWLAGHMYDWPPAWPRTLLALLLVVFALFLLAVLVLRVWRAWRDQALAWALARGEVPASFEAYRRARSLRWQRLFVFGAAALVAATLVGTSLFLGGPSDGSAETLVFEPAK